jgi:hypothetical protein
MAHKRWEGDSKASALSLDNDVTENIYRLPNLLSAAIFCYSLPLKSTHILAYLCRDYQLTLPQAFHPITSCWAEVLTATVTLSMPPSRT